jgi:hypothetical protein
MIAKSPKEAKALGLDRYNTGRPCKHGHVADRRVDNGTCIECLAARSAEWAKANRDEMSLHQRKYRLRNPDAIRERSKTYHEQNREARSKAMREWYAKNKDRMRELNREWVGNNKVRLYARMAARRAKHKRAIPKWLSASDFRNIEAIYQQARDTSSLTGVPHHVDHVLPLNGEYVSGLHVPENLRVVSAVENARKKNRFLPELLERHEA